MEENIENLPKGEGRDKPAASCFGRKLQDGFLSGFPNVSLR